MHIGAIFCDMDQVLVNFLGGARRALGMEFNDPKFPGQNRDKWLFLATIPLFWDNLPWMPEAQILWDRIKGPNTYILSACPLLEENPTCPGEKMTWCVRELGVSPGQVLTVHRRREKKNFATTNGKANLIIDDHIDTINGWRDAGGIAIHHHTIPETLYELNLLGI